MNLKDVFIQVLSRYTHDSVLWNQYWAEIVKSYSHKKRHYHTLLHLQHLLNQLNGVKDNIQDWDTLMFTLYYHDIVYNSLKSDNEEKSADLAVERMIKLNCHVEKIESCRKQILATKAHILSDDMDTNYFLDADLSVLGHSWDVYETYYQNVRKEYFIYPDLVYKPGRKKVLKHFLAMNRIFKTDFFFEKYELQAKSNLKRELEVL